MPFLSKSHIFSSLGTPTLKNSCPRWTPTCAASSIMRAFRRRPHAKAATLLHSNGGAWIAFLHLYCAKSAAGSHTSFSLFTGSKNGSENTSSLRGYGRSGCAYNLGTLGIHAPIKSWVSKPLILKISTNNAVTAGFRL